MTGVCSLVCSQFFVCLFILSFIGLFVHSCHSGGNKNKVTTQCPPMVLKGFVAVWLRFDWLYHQWVLNVDNFNSIKSNTTCWQQVGFYISCIYIVYSCCQQVVLDFIMLILSMFSAHWWENQSNWSNTVMNPLTRLPLVITTCCHKNYMVTKSSFQISVLLP